MVSGVVVVGFGAMTLWLNNDLFIKLKPTIVNSLFGGILLGGLFLFNKPLLPVIFGSVFQLDAEGWRKLTFRYGLYFLAVAIANEVFRSPTAVTAIWSALNLGTPDPNGVWTGFRGVLWIAASIFGLCQVPLIMKNMIKDEEPGPISPDTGL